MNCVTLRQCHYVLFQCDNLATYHCDFPKTILASGLSSVKRVDSAGVSGDCFSRHNNMEMIVTGVPSAGVEGAAVGVHFGRTVTCKLLFYSC